MTPRPSRKETASSELNSSTDQINEELHSSVLSFLKKLGYRQTEQSFKDEARNAGIEPIAFEIRAEQDSSLQPAVLMEELEKNGQKKNPECLANEKSSDTVYEIMFAKLKKWIYDSLDIYRDELNQILYPMFVHCFLDVIAKNLSSNGTFIISI